MKTSALGKITPAPLPDDAVKMSIDSAGMDLLMENLTNLYESPHSAVLREYMSNAVDAHKAALTPPERPIEMTLTTTKLTLQDFGVGMSKEDMANIYARYGASTKRDTNAQIGGFGLGAKSALAIADRFDITSVKDGWETVAYIEKTQERAATLFFISRTQTSEPSGTTVRIPLKRQNLDTLLNEAKKRIRCFPDNMFRLNGKPQHDNVHSIPWFTVNDGMTPVGYVKLHTRRTTENRQWNNLVAFDVSVGGVYYDLHKFNLYESGATHEDWTPHQKFNRFGHLFKDFSKWLKNHAHSNVTSPPILNLPVSSVDLTPSRDSFISTDRTYDTFKQVIQAFKNSLNTSFQQALLSLPADQGMLVAALNPALVKEGKISGADVQFTLKDGTSYPYEIPLPHIIVTAGEKIAPKVDHTPRWLRMDTLAERTKLTSKLQYSHAAYARSTVQNGKTVFLTVPSLDAMSDKNDVVKKVNRMVRDYARGTFGHEAIELYIIDQNVIFDALPAPFTALVDDVTDFDNFTRVAKEARKAKMSNAQTGVMKNKMTQVVYDVAAGTVQTMKESDISASGKDVYHISIEDQHLPHLYQDNVTTVPPLYAAVTRAECPEATVINDHTENMYKHVVPDSYIVIIPAKKSTSAYEKRTTNTSPLIQKVLHFTQSTVKSKADKELFYDLVTLLRTNDQGGVLDLIRGYHGPGYTLEDPALQAIQSNSDIYHAAVALYPFINTAQVREKRMEYRKTSEWTPVVLKFWKSVMRSVGKNRADISDRYAVLFGSALFQVKTPPGGHNRWHLHSGRGFRAYDEEGTTEQERSALAFNTLNALYRGFQV